MPVKRLPAGSPDEGQFSEDDMGEGVMVALFLETDAAEKLALGGYEPAEDLHITLKYCGLVEDLDDVDAARLVLSAKYLADMTSPLTGRISGFGRFVSDDPEDFDVFYATPEIAGLDKIRARLCSVLKEAGVEHEDDQDDQRSFIPHITLAYLDQEDPTPEPPEGGRNLPLSFDKLTVAIGDKHVEIPLTGHEMHDQMAMYAEKTEDGESYPSSAFAYVPDPEMPSTWKLRLWESPSEKVTAAQVGRAIAALGKGFRGNKVQIPDGDLAGVKAKVRSAWKSVHTDEEVPDILQASEDEMDRVTFDEYLHRFAGKMPMHKKDMEPDEYDPDEEDEPGEYSELYEFTQGRDAKGRFASGGGSGGGSSKSTGTGGGGGGGGSHENARASRSKALASASAGNKALGNAVKLAKAEGIVSPKANIHGADLEDSVQARHIWSTKGFIGQKLQSSAQDAKFAHTALDTVNQLDAHVRSKKSGSPELKASISEAKKHYTDLVKHTDDAWSHITESFHALPEGKKHKNAAIRDEQHLSQAKSRPSYDKVTFGEVRYFAADAEHPDLKDWRLFLGAEVDASTSWIPMLPAPGNYQHSKWGTINITPERNARFIRNFRDEVYQTRLPIDAEHQLKVSGAVGWINGLRQNSDGSVDANVEWTQRGRNLVESKAFRYISPEWWDSWIQPDTGRKFRDVLSGAAIVTRPFFKERALRPLVASEPGRYTLQEEDDMDQRQFAEMEYELAGFRQLTETLGADLKQANERIRAMENDARHKRFTDIVLGNGGETDGVRWIGDTAQHVSFMENLAETFGEDSDMFRQYVEQNTSHAQTVRTEIVGQGRGSRLSGGAAVDSGAGSRFLQASEKVAAEKGITLADAMAEVSRDQPRLFAEYRQRTAIRTNSASEE